MQASGESLLHFLGAARDGASEFRRLMETVVSDDDIIKFINCLSVALEESPDRGGMLDNYLDRMLAWLRSPIGREMIDNCPNEWSATAIVLYVGTRSAI